MPRPAPTPAIRHDASLGKGSDSSQASSVNSDDEHSDEPRVAQWVDEEELDEVSSSEDVELEESSSNMTALKRDLSQLPLGTLVRAQRAIKIAPQDGNGNDSDSSDKSKPELGSVAGASTQKLKRKIEHRSNKHAPTEMTSKKPVPRRRQVVEVHTYQPRDPRFSDLSGQISTDRFRSQYGFLSELHAGELSTLKQTLARARKLLISSPRDLRKEREEEVTRLELAVKRAESTVNREKQEAAEQKALGQLRREEQEKRKAGKKGWYLKDADEKAVKVRARMDAIAASGGKRAVKKAIEKKQRKMGQKAKKSRPFAQPQKRQREDAGTHEIRPKRRRMSE